MLGCVFREIETSSYVVYRLAEATSPRLVYDFIMGEDGLCAHWCLSVIPRHRGCLVVFLCPLLGRLSSSVLAAFRALTSIEHY